MSKTTNWDTTYEWKAVTALSIGFGLLGLDRWIIGPLFPAMSKDLGLDYSVLGSAAGALALAWGVFSIAAGNISDRLGRRKVLIPAIVIFSLFSCLTGLTGGVITLLAVRALMGMAEGAYLPTSVAAVAEASHPLRRGRTQGIQLGMFPLFGFGFGPILATQLLAIVPSWRYVLFLVAVPGLITAFFLYLILREPDHLQKRDGPAPERLAWSEMLKSRNVALGALALVCAMSCVFVIGAMAPSYLTDYRGLSVTTMGFVMSAMGWGGFLGEIGVAGISDYIGRRAATLLAFIGAIVATWIFFHGGSNPAILFFSMGVLSFFGLGLTSIITGPIATEAAPVALTSSAIGIVSGLGEIFGGGIAPGIAGFVAQNYGIGQIYWIPVIGLSIGVLVSLALKESAPRLTGIHQYQQEAYEQTT